MSNYYVVSIVQHTSVSIALSVIDYSIVDCFPGTPLSYLSL